MNITQIVGFTAGFTVTDRASGDVLVDASAADAAVLQTLYETGNAKPGGNAVLDALADAVADACTGSRQIDIDAGNGATAIALFERVGVALGFAKMMGQDVTEAVYFSSKADDLPSINVPEMAEVATPLLQLVSALKQRSAMAEVATHAGTNSIN